MAKGKEIHRKLITKGEELQSQLDTVSTHVLHRQQMISTLQNRRLSTLTEIANLHLNEVAQGADKTVFRGAEGVFLEASVRLAEIAQESKELQNKIAAADNATAGARRYFDLAVAERDEARQRFEVAMAASEQALQEDPQYQALYQADEQAKAQAKKAEERLTGANEERQAKKKPYLQDPFFTYLRSRAYGTTEYKGSGLTALLDGWVADLSHFRVNQENFTLMDELSRYLGTHNDAMRNLADKTEEALNVFIKQYRFNSPAYSLGVKLKEAEEAVEKRKAALVQAEKQRKMLSDELTQLTVGQDSKTQRVIQNISGTLGRMGIEHLETLAKKTASPKDDLLVKRLAEYADQQAELENEIANAQTKRKLLAEAKDKHDRLLKKFIEQGYHKEYSTFGRGFDIDTFWLGYLAGNSTFGELAKHQKTEEPPSYSTTSYDYGHRTSSSSRRNDDDSWGGFGGGGSIGGGGGFSSGGGFGGGGGFSSGGDF